MPEEPYPEQESGAGDQKASRTLDERQVGDQDVSELEERESGHAPLWYEQEVPPAYLMRDEEIVGTEEAGQVDLASRPVRDPTRSPNSVSEAGSAPPRPGYTF